MAKLNKKTLIPWGYRRFFKNMTIETELNEKQILVTYKNLSFINKVLMNIQASIELILTLVTGKYIGIWKAF
ncbi:MAG: hypothetical protein ACYSSI_08815 [Planctomycetota bacterium]|jgi:predicted ATPase